MTTTNYERDTIEILRELTRDWDTGLAGEIGPSTAIVADLAFESLDVVHLIAAVEQRYERFDLPFEDLLMEDGHYVEDLTVNQIACFLQQHLDSTEGAGR